MRPNFRLVVREKKVPSFFTKGFVALCKIWTKNMYFMNNIRCFLFLLFIILCSYNLYSQSDMAIGDWKAYLGHSQAKQTIERDSIIYCITEGGMFSYDLKENNFRSFSSIDGLTDVLPNSLFYHKDEDMIFLGYNDGSIDYFQNPDEIHHFTDIQRNDFYTQKAVIDFAGKDSLLYVATDFGLVIFDLNKAEPKFTVTQVMTNPVRTMVKSLTVFEDKIWVSVGDSGLFCTNVNTINLSDPAIWQKVSGTNGLPKGIASSLVSNNDNLFVIINNEIYHKTINNNWTKYPLEASSYSFLRTNENELLIYRGDGYLIEGDMAGTNFNYRQLDGGMTDIDKIGGDVWYTNIYVGLYKMNVQKEFFIPPGPIINYCTRMAVGKRELYIAPLGYDQSLVPQYIGSGIFAYSKKWADNAGWKILNSENNGLPTNRANWNFVRAFYDKNTDKVYMGTWGKGICVLKDGALQTYYDCANSSLSYIYNTCDTFKYDNIRIGGLETDANGTLWIVNSEAHERLQALTADGTWYNMRASFVSPTAQLIGLTIDDYGNKWVLRRRELPITYNDKNTPENISDDVTATVFPPQDVSDDVFRFNEVFSFVKDKEGDIWLGTDRGIRVVYSNFLADMAEGTNVEARAPIYEGYPLLRSQAVTAIAVDGGNRKWIGTGEGVFLVSPDGEKILEHFTSENSPLVSDFINDIKIDDETGEVYFGTPKGTISYRAGATEGKSPCTDVTVFPNPVFSNFEGDISIQGSAESSIVKIATVSGMLVREISSAGGTALWDGRDIQGNKVVSGIYLVLIAQKNGQNACVGKLTVINR